MKRFPWVWLILAVLVFSACRQSPQAQELLAQAELGTLEATEVAQTPPTEPVGDATADPALQPTTENLPIDPTTAPDLQTVEEIPAGPAVDLAWVASADAVVVSTENRILLYSVSPLAITDNLRAATPTNLATSTFQPWAAWATSDNTVHIWSAAEGSEVLARRAGAAVTSLAFHPQQDHLAVATSENTVQVWSVLTDTVSQSWSLPYWLSNLSFSPDGSLLAGADLMNFTVHIFDVASGQEQRTLAWTESASPALYDAFFSPDWARLAWVARGTVQLMDANTGTLGPTLSHEDFVNDAAWSPDASLLATASAGTINDQFVPIVTLWNTQDGTVVQTLPQTEAVTGLSFSPDGTQLAILFSDGGVELLAVAP